jgi:hypothetical protein
MFFKTLAVKHYRNTDSRNAPYNYHGDQQVMKFHVPGWVFSTMNTTRFQNTKYSDQNKRSHIKDITATLYKFNEPVINNPNYQEEDIHTKNEGRHVYYIEQLITGFAPVKDVVYDTDKGSGNACEYSG